MVCNGAKSDIDSFTNLINPDMCPDKMLPLLASYVGYNYDYNESADANRLIIKYYNNLIRYRGSETGIRLAMALSVNTSGQNDIDSLSMFKISYDKDNNMIKIYLYYPSYLYKVRDLIEVVRPAGVPIEFVSATPIETIDKVDIVDYINNDKETYGRTRYNISTDNKVGFGQVEKNK
jgi:phage tail-like protein